MKFAFSSALPLSLLALCVATGCNKNKPDGTTPPASEASDSNGDPTSPGADDGADGEPTTDGSDEPTAPVAKACAAKVADAPTALFGEQVLIRPPINVELNEENPTMALAFVSGGFISACDAPVDRMNLMVFPNDPKKSLKDFTAEFVDVFLVKGGYTNGTKTDLKPQSDTDYHLKVEYPPAGGQAPAALYIAVKRRFKNVFVMVYQTPVDAFKVLEPTFTESANSLLVKPPA